MQIFDIVVDRDTCSVSQIIAGEVVASLARNDGSYASTVKDTAQTIHDIILAQIAAPGFRVRISALEQTDIDEWQAAVAAQGEQDAKVHDSEQQGSSTPPASIFD